MKRFASLFVWAIVIGGCSSWFFQSFVRSWEPSLRQEIETAASQALHTRVVFDNLSILFLHRARLDNVQIYDPIKPDQRLFRAADISITLSLINLPRAILHRNPLEAVGLISIHNPVVLASPEDGPWLQALSGAGSLTHARPLLFSIEWDQGTIQWRFAETHGSGWTLYQTEGRFAIRGPSTVFALKGSSQLAEKFRFQFATFGQRWNSQFYIRQGDIRAVQDLVEKTLKRPLFKTDVNTSGHFDVTAYASGRRFPKSREDEWRFLKKGTLKLNHVVVQSKSRGMSVAMSGAVVLSGSRLACSNLIVSSNNQTLSITGDAGPVGPHLKLHLSAQTHLDLAALTLPTSTPSSLEGVIDLNARVIGDWRDPEITFAGTLPRGRFFHFPVQDVLVNLSEQKNQWRVDGTQLQVLGGHLRLGGTISEKESDLKLTGEGLHLQNLTGPERLYLSGESHFSASLLGGWTAPILNGGFWIDHFVYGQNSVDELRGSFESSLHHFLLRASSSENVARVLIEGNADDGGWAADPVQFSWASGAHASGHFSYREASRAISGQWNFSQLSVPGDLPFLDQWVTTGKGTAQGHGILRGTLDHPELVIDVESDDVRVGRLAPAQVQGQFFINNERLGFTSFRSDNGIRGRWTQALGNNAPFELSLNFSHTPAEWITPLVFKQVVASGTLTGVFELSKQHRMTGRGHLRLQDGALGRWPVSSAEAAFDMQPGRLAVSQLMVYRNDLEASLAGKAHWRMAGPVLFSLYGKAKDGGNQNTWEAPLTIAGEFSPDENWKGHAALHVAHPKIKNYPTSPFHADVEWAPRSLVLKQATLGAEWSSRGSLRWVPETKSPQCELWIEAHHAPLAPWMSLWRGSASPPFDGQLSATLSVKGPLDQPIAHVEGKIEDGRWKAFSFDNQFSADGNLEKIDPVLVNGMLKEGGNFQLNGGVNLRTRSVFGEIKLMHLQLRPLGESLRLPRPLTGWGNAALSVMGPLSHPQASGLFEGGPVVYDSSDGAPLRIDHYHFDVLLAPSPDKPYVSRLTLREGTVKTVEEQIRLMPQSFIEFSGEGPSRLTIGSQIRNLHLGPFTVFGGLDLNGTWNVTPTSFDIQGDAQTHSLFINDFELQEGRLTAHYVDNVLTFEPQKKGPTLIRGAVNLKTANLRFEDFYISGKDKQGLLLNGTIGSTLWDFSLKGDGLDLTSLGGLGGLSYPLEGTANLLLRGTGDSQHPHIEGSVNLRDGRILGLHFENGSSNFVWQDNRITFSKLLLTDDGRYNLSGAGFLPVQTQPGSSAADNAIDFSLRLTDSNLGILKSISDEVKQAKGPVDGLLQITGTTDQPTLRGHLQVKDGDVTGAHYFRHLQNFNLSADFDKDELRIQTMSGTSGKGTFKIDGSIAFSGLTPRFYDLNFQVPSDKGLDVQIPELAIPESPLAKRFHFLTTSSRAEMRGAVSFKGPAESPTFAGDCSITNGHFTFPPSGKTPPPESFLEWVRRINWNILLKFSDGAWFENELVEANLVGQLRLKGPSDRLRVDGGMEISEGSISYLGVDFDLKEAHFDMRSSETDAGIVNTPYIRGIGESQVQAVDSVSGQATGDATNQVDVTDTIQLTIDYAPIDQIKPRLTSTTNPGLSQDKVLARVSQLDTDNLTSQEKTYLYQQQMVRLLDTGFVTPLARNLLKRTGLVTDVRVSRVINPAQPALNETPAGTPTQSQTGLNLLANTKYTFERNLSNRLSLGYGLRFESVSTPDFQQSKLDLVNDIELSYRWFRNVYLRGSFDLPTSDPSIIPDRKITIEPRWRFGWWGNTNKDKVVQQ